MTEYALVRPDNTIDRVQSDAVVDPSVLTKTGWRWLLAVTTRPSFDPLTQVVEGPVVTVGQTQVDFVYNVRSKTAGELDADKEAQLPDATSVMFRVLFNHENRVRVLEQRQAVTADQFRAAIKALL